MFVPLNGLCAQKGCGWCKDPFIPESKGRNEINHNLLTFLDSLCSQPHWQRPPLLCSRPTIVQTSVAAPYIISSTSEQHNYSNHYRDQSTRLRHAQLSLPSRRPLRTTRIAADELLITKSLGFPTSQKTRCLLGIVARYHGPSTSKKIAGAYRP